MAKVKAIDFFCGAGGLTRGLLDAGIDVLAGVDNDARLQDTYQSNNEPSRFIHNDINSVEIEALRAELGIGSDDLTLYAACTPCQPFSTLNTMKGADARKSLLLDFAKIVEKSPPDFILVENVPGLNNAIGREISAWLRAASAMLPSSLAAQRSRLADASPLPHIHPRAAGDAQVGERLAQVGL